MKLHPGRSIKTNLANVVKAQLKLAAKIDRLNDQAKDLLELRTRLEQLLFLPSVPLMSKEEFAQKFLGDQQPDHHEQSQVELAGTGDNPKAPQATDKVSIESIEIDHGPFPGQKAAVLMVLTDKLVRGTMLAPRKPGWPPGLSRTKTPCPHSLIPHRHRVDNPSKPTEMTCVNIIFPKKDAQERPQQGAEAMSPLAEVS